MMHIVARALAIETSGSIGSIALAEDSHVLVEEQFLHGLQHAAEIVPIIDRLTRARGWTPSDLQQVFVSIGPGSFTGLRIAVTLAKSMALATGVKIVAVPTVRALVENAPADARDLIVVLDAKRDQIFTAAFARDASGGWNEREPAHLDSLAEMLRRAPRPVHLLGEGIPYHRKFVLDDTGVIITAEDTWRARAAAVATIGDAMAARAEFVDPYTLTPLYIRKPEAEEKFESQARPTRLA